MDVPPTLTRTTCDHCGPVLCSFLGPGLFSPLARREVLTFCSRHIFKSACLRFVKVKREAGNPAAGTKPPPPCSAVAEMIQVSRWRRPQRCRNELLPADATQKETGEFPLGGLRLCHSRDVIAGPATGFSQLEPRVDVQIPRWSPAPEKKTRDSFCVFWVQTRLNCQQFPAEVPRPPSPRCNSEAPASESSCRTLQNPAELCRTSRLQLRRFRLSFFFQSWNRFRSAS